ncbi:MAG: aminoacetone oxidase family FAD-binding enzyme [Oscillospiraceae bacterium]|nr:aminoacetone oxidase family FAD-binding enzyme [Oscillospiraceae bacterium]
MKRQKYDVCVIGGGAAGMMAAITAAGRGRSVLLMEKSDRLGRKLRITGKGRCNVTNSCTERECIDSIPTGGRFMTSAIYAFPPKAAMSFFEGLGVPLKTERGNRVFPVSDKAYDIVDALRRAMRHAGVELAELTATGIETCDGAVTGVRAGDTVIACESAIIATGGKSYPLTGSTGDGYKFAAELGHKIVDIKPSLVPLETADDYCPRMQGLALKNVALTVK